METGNEEEPKVTGHSSADHWKDNITAITDKSQEFPALPSALF